MAEGTIDPRTLAGRRYRHRPTGAVATAYATPYGLYLWADNGSHWRVRLPDDAARFRETFERVGEPRNGSAPPENG